MTAGTHGCVNPLRLIATRPSTPSDLRPVGTLTVDGARAWIAAVDRLARTDKPRRPADPLLISAAQSADLAAHLPVVELECFSCGRVRRCVHTYQEARDLRRQMFSAVLRWGRRSGRMLPDCA